MSPGFGLYFLQMVQYHKLDFNRMLYYKDHF